MICYCCTLHRKTEENHKILPRWKVNQHFFCFCCCCYFFLSFFPLLDRDSWNVDWVGGGDDMQQRVQAGIECWLLWWGLSLGTWGAPELSFFKGKFYLYFLMSQHECNGSLAIVKGTSVMSLCRVRQLTLYIAYYSYIAYSLIMSISHSIYALETPCQWGM